VTRFVGPEERCNGSSLGPRRPAAPVSVVVDRLGKRFGDRWAVQSVSFSVGAGRVLGLLGPNGAGKTTTVRMLATLSRPDRGHAAIGGLDVVRHAAEVRRVISLAGQYAAVDLQLTGVENLRLVGRLQHLTADQAASRADRLLAEFGLVEVGSRLVRTYSGGMRRRLDLAAAVVHEPAVLFLDEPTTGLDPTSRVGMWAAVRALVDNGTTVVLTTQYLEEADRLCDDLVVIDRGEVVAAGSPDELKAAVGGDVVEIVADGALATQRAAALAERACGARATVDVATGRIVLPVGGNAARAVASVARALDEAGVGPLALGIRRPSLDEVFVALTGADQDGTAQGSAPHPGLPTAAATAWVDGPGSGARHRGTSGHRLPLGSLPVEPVPVRPLPVRPLPVGPAALVASALAAAGLQGDERHAAVASRRWRNTLVDWTQVARRNALHIARQPLNAVFLLVQPVMFVVMFRYVFGGALALAVGKGSYVEFLLPGIVAQTMAFGSMSSAVGLAEDLGTGMVDRIRSLPVARSAVLVGRLAADAVQYVAVMAVMVVVGTAVGFRFERGPLAGLAMGALAVAFGLVVSAFAALLGVRTGDPQAAMTVGLTVLFPVCFVSGAFIPVATLPGWLQPVARANPVTVVVEAMRALAAGGPVAARTIQAAAWMVALAAVLVPLAVRALRRAR